GAWMSAIECQLAQGCVGDLIVIRGKNENNETIPVQFTSDVVLGPDKKPRWKKGGEPQVFTQRQLWWSLHDPDFQELLDTRGKEDVESPLGGGRGSSAFVLAIGSPFASTAQPSTNATLFPPRPGRSCFNARASSCLSAHSHCSLAKRSTTPVTSLRMPPVAK